MTLNKYISTITKSKRHAMLSLVIIVFVLCASFSYITLDEGDDDPVEEALARIHGSGHTVPAEDPFFSIGCDFLVIKAENLDPELVILFNNTRVYIDTNNDQVWDYDYLRNASDEMIIENVDAGARIHSDKPIWYRQWLDATSTKYTYATVPTITNLVSDYYVYSGTWYIVAPSNINVYIDNTINGSIDTTTPVSPLVRESFTVTDFARVYSNESFYLYNKYAVVCPSSYDFFLWNENITKLIVTEDNTTVKVDHNNDGFYDDFHFFDRGVFSLSEQEIGAHVNSDKPINIVQRNFFTNSNFTVTTFSDSYSDSMSYVMPGTMLGSDYYGIETTSSHKNAIIGSFSNTTYHLDRLVENDLQINATDSVGPNQVKQVVSVSNYSHIWANKPFSLYRWSTTYSFYPNLPAAYIFATTSHTPNELGLNTTATMHIRVFNPTADTNITNVSVGVTFPDTFSLSGGTTVDVTVKKYFLRNDTLIETKTEAITPTSSDGNYTFTLNSTSFSDIFDYLDVLRYYQISYQIRTPTTAGNYNSPPAEVKYNASTWKITGGI